MAFTPTADEDERDALLSEPDNLDGTIELGQKLDQILLSAVKPAGNGAASSPSKVSISQLYKLPPLTALDPKQKAATSSTSVSDRFQQRAEARVNKNLTDVDADVDASAPADGPEFNGVLSILSAKGRSKKKKDKAEDKASVAENKARRAKEEADRVKKKHEDRYAAPLLGSHIGQPRFASSSSSSTTMPLHESLGLPSREDRLRKKAEFGSTSSSSSSVSSAEKALRHAEARLASEVLQFAKVAPAHSMEALRTAVNSHDLLGKSEAFHTALALGATLSKVRATVEEQQQQQSSQSGSFSSPSSSSTLHKLASELQGQIQSGVPMDTKTVASFATAFVAYGRALTQCVTQATNDTKKQDQLTTEFGGNLADALLKSATSSSVPLNTAHPAVALTTICDQLHRMASIKATDQSTTRTNAANFWASSVSMANWQANAIRLFS